MVSTDKKIYFDIHKASYIYFVKIFVSNFITVGNLSVYEMTEDKKRLFEREPLLKNKSGSVYTSSCTVS